MRFTLQFGIVLILLFHLDRPALANDLNNEPSPWIFVDTQARTLSVLQGGKTLHTFTDISIGRSGTSHAKISQDGTTPLGKFKVSHIIEDSPFVRFFGLNYPGISHATEALASGLITAEEFARIRSAHRHGRVPPQNTALGGHIGIHGVGKGDPVIHEEFNWTNGCVALRNEQLRLLGTWVGIGTRVVIQ